MPGVEVLDAVRGRGVDDAGALLQGDKLTQVHRRDAIVERMLERQPLERRALGARNHRALEPKAREAAFDQIGGEQKMTPRGAQERISEVWIDVERLVGR